MKFLLPLTLALLPFAGTAAGQKQSNTKEALTRGLDSIQADKIRADLTFLASDEMGGRDTPSPEQKIAARFIKDRLEQLGITPGFKDSYIWTFDRDRWLVVSDETHMTFHIGESDFKLAVGNDFFHNSSAASNRSSAKVGLVFMGDAKKAHEAKGEIEGCWVICEGTRRPSGKVRTGLKERGALGVLMMPNRKAKKSVVDTHSANHERMIQPRWGKPPEDGAFGIVYLTEQAASHVKSKIKGKKAGHKLDVTVSETCQIEILPTTLENVVGLWPGSDPELKNEVIIISAHYDHVGKRPDGTIFNGADDNASGTSGLLAITAALKEYGPMRRSIMVMWVSGEEKGLWGSDAWTKNPWFPEGMRAVCNINIDMIGRNAGDELLITPTKRHDEYSWLTKVAEKHRSKEGFKKLGSADDYYRRSDHYNFRKNLNVPVIFLFADVHEDYHQPTDTPDKINYDKAARVSRLVLRVLDGLQTDKLDD